MSKHMRKKCVLCLTCLQLTNTHL